MANNKRLIFKINNLQKHYGTYNALKLKKLDIHPGTIYGVVGTIGSGKSTLLNLMAGFEKQTSGSLLYEGKYIRKTGLERLNLLIVFLVQEDPYQNGRDKIVADYISNNFHKKKNLIENRYFKNGSFKHLWSRRISKLSSGELNWLGMVVALESDPRVLLNR